MKACSLWMNVLLLGQTSWRSISSLSNLAWQTVGRMHYDHWRTAECPNQFAISISDKSDLAITFVAYRNCIIAWLRAPTNRHWRKHISSTSCIFRHLQFYHYIETYGNLETLLNKPLVFGSALVLSLPPPCLPATGRRVPAKEGTRRAR